MGGVCGGALGHSHLGNVGDGGTQGARASAFIGLQVWQVTLANVWCFRSARHSLRHGPLCYLSGCTFVTSQSTAQVWSVQYMV